MKNKRMFSAVLAVVFAVLFCFCSCVLPDMPQISDEASKAEVQASVDYSSFSSEKASEANESDGETSFHIVFFDIGQGDSALVQCDGRYMLIDGGQSSASSVIYTVLKKHGVTHLDYIIATHAHSDHVGGLSAAFQVCSVDTVYCPVTEYDSKAFTSFKEKAEEACGGIQVPKAGQSFKLGSSTVSILAPLKDYDEPNNTSIVLKIQYGETSFLFVGDAERESEADMYESGVDLSATLLKVGHHGSSSSTSYLFLREVMPEYAIISCGKNNSYGHPHDEVLSRLKDADVTVFRTDERSDITCYSDGKSLRFDTRK